MERINELIAILIAIQNFSKDIHYTCSGSASFSKHLLADRVQEEIYDFIDGLKETCILGTFKEPLASSEYLVRAVALIPEVKKEDDLENFKALSSLLLKGRRICNDICSDGSYEAGVNNIVGGIAEYLMNQSGVVFLQVKPYIPTDEYMESVEDKIKDIENRYNTLFQH